MKISEYYNDLNTKSQEIFKTTLEKTDVFAKSHSAAIELYEISKEISKDEGSMIQAACSQLESSCLALSLGLYRPAFISLRLSLELGLGAIHFSVNKMQHKEWINGSTEGDIKWSSINNPDTGVFSSRFALAFFPELKPHISTYREIAKTIYRELSQYVHGNNETWKETGISIAYKEVLIDKFSHHIDEILKTLKFSFCCRYFLELNAMQLERVEPFFIQAFTHIEPIRIRLGGQKDLS